MGVTMARLVPICRRLIIIITIIRSHRYRRHLLLERLKRHGTVFVEARPQLRRSHQWCRRLSTPPFRSRQYNREPKSASSNEHLN